MPTGIPRNGWLRAVPLSPEEIQMPPFVKKLATVSIPIVLLSSSACGSDGPAPAQDAAATVADPVISTSAPASAHTIVSAATSESPTTESPATESPTTPPATRATTLAELDPLVTSFLERARLNGAGLVIVDRDDGVVYEEYWGELGPDRVSLIASSGKMIAAGVLLHLDDAGLLDIDAPIAAVLPAANAHPDITAAQLVSNSSGLVGLDPDPAYPPYICQYTPDRILRDCVDDILTTPEDDADVVPPDTQFRYGGAQWQVAGGVAEAASGRSWEQLLEDVYRTPCEVESLGFNSHFLQLGAEGYPRAFNGDPTTLATTQNPNIEAGAYITAADYAQILLMHLREGRCGTNQVLSPAALDRMHLDRTESTYEADTSYGMGWWIDSETGIITDPGLYGSMAWLDLADGYGAYLALEADDGGDGEALAKLLYAPIDTAMGLD
jgi:CubicO group peptidase (beta-lactamase class C family)